jgi:hypothetical protein
MKTSGERAQDDINNAKEVKGMNSNEGVSYEFLAVGRRDQLFARLISHQRWESL